jgi:hypothetical protein
MDNKTDNDNNNKSQFYIQTTFDSVFFNQKYDIIINMFDNIINDENTYKQTLKFFTDNDNKSLIPFIPLNKDIVNIILEYIVPLYTSNDIFNWITTIENELNTLEEEDKFDMVYYDFGCKDYNWANKRLLSIKAHKLILIKLKTDYCNEKI